jgi:hypothetical protein
MATKTVGGFLAGSHTILMRAAEKQLANHNAARGALGMHQQSIITSKMGFNCESGITISHQLTSVNSQLTLCCYCVTGQQQLLI